MGIILMHDFKRHTAEALPELIQQLKAGGYKVVHSAEGIFRPTRLRNGSAI